MARTAGAIPTSQTRTALAQLLLRSVSALSAVY
jgi:hypothetical protein